MYSEINYASSNIKNIKAGELRFKYSAAGDRVLRYYIDFRHTVLDLHKEVSAAEIAILQNKVDTLMAVWDSKFEVYQKKTVLVAGKETAENMAIEEDEKRGRLQNILHQTLNIDDTVDWEVLKEHSKFERS